MPSEIDEPNHFRDLFFNPLVVDHSIIESLPQLDIDFSLDKEPVFEEILARIAQVNMGKARGLDGISIEIPVMVAT